MKNDITLKEGRIKVLIADNENLENLSEITKIEEEIKKLTKEITKIDIALSYLCDEDRFIIDKKYIENKSWMEVEDEFNIMFKKKPPVTYKALQVSVRKTYRILKLILEPNIKVAS